MSSLYPDPEDEKPVKPVEPTFPSDEYIVEGEKIDIPKYITRDDIRDIQQQISQDKKLED